MIKLKIKLTRSDLQGLGVFFFSGLKIAQVHELYTPQNYAVFWNLKDLQKTFVVKYFTPNDLRTDKKTITVHFTVNQYEALKWLRTVTSQFANLDPYYETLTREIFTTLHKQEIIYSNKTNFNFYT